MHYKNNLFKLLLLRVELHHGCRWRPEAQAEEQPQQEDPRLPRGVDGLAPDAGGRAVRVVPVRGRALAVVHLPARVLERGRLPEVLGVAQGEVLVKLAEGGARAERLSGDLGKKIFTS